MVVEGTPQKRPFGPVTDLTVDGSDDTIRQGVVDADLGVLAATLEHLSGGQWRAGPDWQSAIGRDRDPDRDNTDSDARGPLLDEATRVLTQLRDGDMAIHRRPSDETLLRAIRVAAGEDPGAEYLLKLLCDFGFDQPAVSAHRPSGRRHAIIGAGLSGIGVAMELTRRGEDFVIFDRNPDVGGTWLENRYPDCGVDTVAHLYSYARRPNPQWSRPFAKRDEILDYLRQVAASTEVDRRIRFGEEVTSCVFDDGRRVWTLTVQRGRERLSYEAEVVISCTGGLSLPRMPDIPGLADFGGRVVHTARWPDDLDPTGLRIGVVGNGSSGVQIGRALAEISTTFTHFQRTPHWVAPNPDAERVHTSSERWLVDAVPYYAEWQKFVTYVVGDLQFPNLVRDPGWTGPGISERNEKVRARLTAYLRSQVGDDDDLFDRLLPRYPPYGKRMVRDNRWLSMFRLPNVELVNTPIERCNESGLVTTDGREHRLDLIVCATGFYGTRYLWPMEVRGRSGQTPSELAGSEDDLRGYLGVLIPDLPNFFLVGGPNGAIGHSGSFFYIAETQIDYIMSCLDALDRVGAQTVECDPAACDRYNAKMERRLSQLVWTDPTIDNRYKNASGRVVSNHPWTMQEYWLMTRSLDPSSLLFDGVHAACPSTSGARS